LLGAAADRLPARGVLVGCDLISASLVGVMVIPGIPVAGMLALLFVAGLVSPVYSGALLRAALSPRGALAVDAVSSAAPPAVLRFGPAARRPRAGRAGSMARDS